MGNASGCNVARAETCGIARGRPHHITEAFAENVGVYEQLHDEVTVHAIICAMDYKLTGDPISSTIDGHNMAALARSSGVKSLTFLTDEESPLTKARVYGAIRNHGSLCTEDDMFLFYFAGHGVQMKHAHGTSAGENSERDDAYCFQNPRGQVNRNSCMTDEEFSGILAQHIPSFTRTIIISDCCHSDTIANLNEDIWAGREVVSLSSCLDSQEAADTGRGGVFTNSILLAVEALQASGKSEYSVQELYNAALSQKLHCFNLAKQRFSIEHSGGVRVQGMSWPLVPNSSYDAPYSRNVRVQKIW